MALDSFKKLIELISCLNLLFRQSSHNIILVLALRNKRIQCPPKQIIVMSTTGKERFQFNHVSERQMCRWKTKKIGETLWGNGLEIGLTKSGWIRLIWLINFRKQSIECSCRNLTTRQLSAKLNVLSQSIFDSPTTARQGQDQSNQNPPLSKLRQLLPKPQPSQVLMLLRLQALRWPETLRKRANLL